MKGTAIGAEYGGAEGGVNKRELLCRGVWDSSVYEHVSVPVG